MIPGTLTTGLAGEAGHWYQPDGRPAYEIVGKNGKQRPVTLRDARQLGLLPGVTSIIKQAAAPGLERWKRIQILLAAATLPRIEGESTDEWVKRVDEDAAVQAEQARLRGVLIHTEIEEAIKGMPPGPYARGVVNWLGQNLPGASWSAERSFASVSYGYGGKVDLSCDIRHRIVIDYKTKEFDDEDDIFTYDDHIMQLVACSIGLFGTFEPSVKLINLFISTKVPGLVVAREHDSQADRLRAWTMFRSLLTYWQASKRV